MTSEEGSFARETIQSRKPAIIDRILSIHDYPPGIRSSLLDLHNELTSKPLRLLMEQTSDKPLWDADLTPWLGKTWLEIPWYLAESYFFRRLLESTAYFQPGPWMGGDPYRPLKDLEIQDALPIFEDYYHDNPNAADLNYFQHLCYQALWGNRGDLSNLDEFDADMSPQSDKILINDSEAAFHYLNQSHLNIAYIFDNTGKELFFDLAMIDYLLTTGLATSVTGFLKNQPFFVSDSMPLDLEKTLNCLETSSSPSLRDLSKRLRDAIKSTRLSIKTPPFFTTSHMFREMPPGLKTDLEKHDLTILKGDVNYRRLFGDRHWHPTTSVEEAAGYFPTSFLSLRTLKAEIILGISQKTYDQLRNHAEPDWLTNGKRGLITFFEKQA